MKALDAIKARTAAATEGPWEVEGDETWAVVTSDIRDIAGLTGKGQQSDAEFIAHAREDVDRLVTAIEAVLAIGGGGMEIGCFRGGYEQALHHVRLTIERALEEGKQ